MTKRVLNKIQENTKGARKSLAVLIDPDDLDESGLVQCLNRCIENKVDYIFVGGSHVTSNFIHEAVSFIKSYTNIPCVLFPGNAIQISAEADAILFISLISGRNPELLIGQHVVAAPVIKKSSLEVIPTGYMLVNSGRPTSASYMSNSQPLPNDKPNLAASTALAGEMLGMQLIYLDAGSGAEEPIAQRIIRSVKSNTSVPLIVGGGLNTKEKIKRAYEAGADVVVIGNGVQKNLDLMTEASDIVQVFNEALNVN
ncbi:geranylgeranylglyceryl/heptaprenylglyceryl phosphate synthase [uncultured Roseivirga sp.]|uniref:geranylgeranylglyceryl/heptaprenylglyceryl phosphate synthase n=1 Tax=uncultured Roseivirga sp. TaxID=543088 RepID=UPI000D7B2173|nr:geranylgeranylglyceryl/heptaprenylglyceryl phosphate synthase [uncultured Roseivirga sp.]PWL30120.1 MAG: geranylgeranylglyceryl/heptaprenylglyceryl phosphate synthase [Roseivirga sp. XM-24bin3]